jgi:hypothetical protein
MNVRIWDKHAVLHKQNGIFKLSLFSLYGPVKNMITSIEINKPFYSLLEYVCVCVIFSKLILGKGNSAYGGVPRCPNIAGPKPW